MRRYERGGAGHESQAHSSAPLIDYMNPPRRRPTTAGDLILLGAFLGMLAVFGLLLSAAWVAL